MGLNITAYKKVTLVSAMDVKQYNADEDAQQLADSGGHTLLYQDGNRPQSDGMPDGIYATEGNAFGFRAGSYSGYNGWRNELATMMLGKSAEEVWRMRALPITATKREAEKALPFVELIDFSDCEGFIGSKTCAKLSADFANHQDKANAGNEQFRALYAKWRKAFALASEGGAVRFH